MSCPPRAPSNYSTLFIYYTVEMRVLPPVPRGFVAQDLLLGFANSSLPCLILFLHTLQRAVCWTFLNCQGAACANIPPRFSVISPFIHMYYCGIGGGTACPPRPCVRDLLLGLSNPIPPFPIQFLPIHQGADCVDIYPLFSVYPFHSSIIFKYVQP
jgi:hypothetical protein